MGWAAVTNGELLDIAEKAWTITGTYPSTIGRWLSDR